MNSDRNGLLHLILKVALTCFCVGIALSPNRVYAQAANDVATALENLKTQAARLGPASIKGEQVLAGKNVPILLFGETKINNNFKLVDALKKEKGAVATFFVKSGDEYVRVATNILKDDGSRAIGTVLDPNGKVIEFIRKGESYYGDADILGKKYVTGYEPILNMKQEIIGIYFVGYPKN